MDIGVILVITSPFIYKRASFTKTYPAVCIPGSFLNLYIKQKVAVLGSIFPITLEKCLNPSASCTNQSLVPLTLWLSPIPHWVTYTETQLQDTWLVAQVLPKAAFCKVLWYLAEILACISVNVQGISPTQGQNHIQWHCKEWSRDRTPQLCGSPSLCMQHSISQAIVAGLKWNSTGKRKSRMCFHGSSCPPPRKFPHEDRVEKRLALQSVLWLALIIVFDKFMEKTWKNLIVRKNKNSEVFWADRQRKIRWGTALSDARTESLCQILLLPPPPPYLGNL